MKILIVDDEYYARKAMIKKTLQVKPEAQIVGDFENGVQVLEFLEEHPDEVDVILTDVRMPEMDGLYLAQYLFEQESGIELVIVSGYNEFEYAKKAMSFGVSNYLVKPVQKEELKEALETIERRRRKYEADVQLMAYRQMEQKTLRYLSMEEIAEHEEWREHFLTPLFEQHTGEAFSLVIFQYRGNEEQEWSETAEQELGKFSRENQTEVFYFQKYREYIILLFGSRENYIKSLYSFVRKVRVTKQLELTAGVSQEYIQPRQCGKAYQEAVYALNQRLINGWAAVYLFSAEIKPVNLMDAEKEHELSAAIREKRCRQAEELCETYLKSCKDSYTLYVTISGIFNLLYHFYCRSSRSEDRDTDHGYMLFSYKIDLYCFETLEDVIRYVQNIVTAMCQEQEEKNHHYMIQEILSDIEKNYQSNISLSELAEHKYFMNSSYLSRLFKTEMGQTFSSYLIDYRLKKAAGLLESDLLKVTDIALLVGYNDVSRFIQYFKKKFNCTPEEYRKRNSSRD